MKKNMLLTFLVAIEIALWAVCIGFSLFFYQGHRRYPDDWVPVLGIVAMLGMGVLFSLFMLGAWRTFQQGQREFDRDRAGQELGLPHSPFDFSLPLSLQGDTLRINRGLRIETVPLPEIYWIHHHHARARRSTRTSYHLHFYLKSGRHILAVFDGGNAAGVRTILEGIPALHPHILISKGHHSQQYKECKRAYRAR